MENSLSCDSVREWTGEDKQEEHRSSPEQLNICGFCGAELSSQLSLTHHINIIHKSNSPHRRHICRYCGGKYAQLTHLTHHVKVLNESSGRERCKML